ncbi:MAG: archaetidylserine decarboxylase [Pseudomonadota bacterium]
MSDVNMVLTILKILPRNLLSRFVGKMMSLEKPQSIVRVLKIWFAGHYQIRLDEAEKSFEDYSSINALFTRKLKPGIRPIGGDVVHPSDSKIAETGAVTHGQILQAKGWTYSVSEFVGNSQLAESLVDGQFVTYYLCPTDYHRVHSPCDGNVKRVRHIPGTLWPVNPASVNGIAGLFVKNERVVFEIETVFGMMALVMVGATNVGKITTSVGPQWITNLSAIKSVREEDVQPEIAVRAGQELGVFHMGSTVICI